MPAVTNTVLFLSLEKLDYWDEMYADQTSAITSRADVNTATTEDAAVRYLMAKPSAVVVTDAGIVGSDEITEKLMEYVRSGGTVVLANHWPSFVQWTAADAWFERWGLPWKCGAYTKEEGRLNENSAGYRKWHFPLAEKYPYEKALYLTNVEPEHQVYSPSQEPDESEEYPEDEQDVVFMPGQSQVVYAPIGDGYLGYIGDVNVHNASQAVLMAMCGL